MPPPKTASRPESPPKSKACPDTLCRGLCTQTHKITPKLCANRKAPAFFAYLDGKTDVRMTGNTKSRKESASDMRKQRFCKNCEASQNRCMAADARQRAVTLPPENGGRHLRRAQTGLAGRKPHWGFRGCATPAFLGGMQSPITRQMPPCSQNFAALFSYGTAQKVTAPFFACPWPWRRTERPGPLACRQGPIALPAPRPCPRNGCAVHRRPGPVFPACRCGGRR